MTDESDLELKFGADTSGLEAGAEESQAAINSISASMAALTAAVQDMTAVTTQGFAAMVAEEKEAVEATEELEVATEREAVSLREMAAGAREGLESLIELRESVSGLAELFLAAFAVEAIKRFAENMGEVAEKTEHTAQAFGMTTNEVQKFQAIFTAAGAGPEALQSSMTRLDRAASQAVSGQKRASDAFKLLGVDIAAPMTPAERLQATLQGFSNIPGPERAAVATAIFGRSITTIAPLLGLSKEALEDYNAQVERYGLENQDAVNQGAMLGATFNENKNAMAGLNDVMTQALAPAFTRIVAGIDSLIAGFIQSYEQGGLAKTFMDTLAVTMNVLTTIFEEIGKVIADVFNALSGETDQAAVGLNIFEAVVVGLGDAFVIVGTIISVFADSVGGAIDELARLLTTFGKIAYDALTGHWDQIGADWQAGLDGISNRVHTAAEKIKSDLASAAEAIKNMGTAPKAKEEDPLTTSRTKPPVLGGEKTTKDKSQMSALEEGEEAFEAERSQNGTLLTNEYQDRLDYWQKVKEGGGLSAEDTIAVNKKVLESQIALNKQNLENTLEASKQASASQIAGIEDTLTAQKAAIAEQIKTIQTGMKDKTVSYTQGNAAIKALLEQQEADEDAAAGAIFTIRTAADEKIVASSAEGTKERQAAMDDEYKAWDALQKEELASAIQKNKAEQASDESTLAARIADWRKFYTQIGDFARTTTEGLIEGTTTWQQAWTKLWEGALDLFLKFIERQVVAWATKETTQTAASVTGEAARTAAAQTGSAQSLAITAETNLKTITSNAASAAAAAYSAMAGIPIIGPILGAAAAAATFTAVEAYGALASAAGGYDIPAGVNPMTQLHQEEMVLPANIAVPLRSAVKSWGAQGSPTASSLVDQVTQNGGGSAVSRGGDTYNTTHQSLDSRSVRRFMDNPNHVKSASKAYARHA